MFFLLLPPSFRQETKKKKNSYHLFFISVSNLVNWRERDVYFKRKKSWLLDCLLIKDLDPKDPVDFVLRFSLMKKK